MITAEDAKLKTPIEQTLLAEFHRSINALATQLSFHLQPIRFKLTPKFRAVLVLSVLLTEYAAYQFP